MYEESGLEPPLTVWWMLIPGLNIWVGFKQIHYLSEYWQRKQSVETLGEASVQGV